MFARQVTLLGLLGALLSPVAAAQVTMDPSAGDLGPYVINSGPHYLMITVTNDNPAFVWPDAIAYGFGCSASGVTILAVQPTSFSLSYQDQIEVTVTYADGAGNGTIHCDVGATNPPTGDAASGDYNVTVVGVSVTPDGGQVVVASNTTDTVGFTVKNTGPNADTFVLTCAKTGGTTCLSVFSPGHAPRTADTVQLGAGVSTAASIVYTVGTTDGTVTLHAIDEVQVASDTGWYNVTVNGPDPTISLVPYNGNLTLAGDGVTYVHATPYVGSMGRTWGLALEYNSAAVHPMSVVSIDVTGPTSPTPSMYELQVQLVSSGVYLTLMNGATAVYYSPTPGVVDRLTAVVDAKANGLATGSYPVNLVLTSTYPRGPRTTIRQARLLVNDQTTSPFGAGVGLVGVGHLYSMTGSYGRLLVDGSGAAGYFDRSCSTCGFVSPAGESRTLVSYNDTLFALTGLDGSIADFNTQGYLVRDYVLAGIQNLTFTWTNNLLTAVTDTSGRGFTLSYSSGLLTQIADFAGRTTKDTIVSGHLVKVIDPDGGVDSLSYNAANLLTQLNSRTGGVWNYGYNALDQGDTVRGPSATDYTGANVRPTTAVVTQAELLWQPGIPGTSAVAPKGSVRPDTVYATSSDPLGNRTRSQLDRFGLATKIVDALGDTTMLTRDTLGNVVHTHDPTKHATTATYDGGQLYSYWSYVLGATYDSSTTEALTYTYDWTTHRLECIQGGRVRLDFFYHDGSQGPAGTLKLVYAGNTEFCGSGFGPTGGAVVAWHYPNAYGQDTLVVDGGGHRIRWIYAPAASGGNLSQSVDALGHVTSYHYNTYGLADTLTLPNGVKNVVSYDTLGRARAATNGLGYTTRYTYGPIGLTRVTDPKGQVYKFDLNVWGALVAQHDLADTTKADSAKYDAGGEVRTAKTRRGDAITLTYDALGRVRTRTGPDFPAESLSYGLLPGGGSWAVATSASGRDSLAFDRAGRVVYAAQHFPGDTTTYALQYTYDAQSRLVMRTGPRNGRTAKWMFDAGSGVLDTMCAVGVCGAISRDTELKPVQVRYNGHWSHFFRYDSRHEVTADSFSVSQLQTDFDTHWGYDSLGRVAVDSLVNTQGGLYPPIAFSYDSVGDLTSACAVGSNLCYYDGLLAYFPARYQYDSAGNRADSLALPMIGAGNRVTRFKNYDITYDANGDVLEIAGRGTYSIWTSTDTTTFQWNGLGQLTRVEHWPSGGAHTVVTFRYDALGRRVGKTMNGVTTWFVYDGDQVEMDVDSTTHAMRAEYAFDANGGLYAVRTPTDSLVAIGTPTIGTVLGLAEATTGAEVKRYAAALTLTWGQSSPDTGFVLRYRMGAQEYEQETGLYHMGARYYAPLLGRWLSEDPAGIAGGLNLYAYAENDPVNGRDPTGMRDCNFDPPTLTCHYTPQDCEDIGESFGPQCGVDIVSQYCREIGGNPVDDYTCKFPDDPTTEGPGPNSSNLISKVKGELCSALPGGRTTGVSGGLGGAYGPVAGGEAVLNYNSGQVSLFGYGGGHLGWNGGASGSLYTGFVYGLNDLNSNYANGFTGLNASALAGGFVAVSSGGPTNPIPNGHVKVIGVSAGASLTTVTGGLTVTNYTKPHQLAKFTSFGTLDYLLYAARQLCK